MARHAPAPFAPLGYAVVAVDRPIDHFLTYKIPKGFLDHVHVGSMVEVGLKNQTARGVVVELKDKPDFRGPIKPIERVLTPDYTIKPEIMALARWVSKYYWCKLGEALSAAAFFGLNDVHAKTKSHLALNHHEHWLTVSREVGPDEQKLTEGHKRVVHALLAQANHPASPGELKEDAGVGDGVLQTMLKRGYVIRVAEPVHRDDDYEDNYDEDAVAPKLMPTQQVALDTIIETLARDPKAGGSRTVLIQGVTGSGKTEIYLQAIEQGLKLGRTAIALVPEISLTPQVVGVFRKRLGPMVGIYHSRMTLGQKYDLWKKIEAHEVRVLIGARSAIFAPMPNLGIIVVDEEHETSYKQGDTPRYHARDLAVYRAATSGAVAVLGSATPSMESWSNAREGKYAFVDLPERIGPHASPVMNVIDMKRHLTEGEITGDKAHIGSLISPQLKSAIDKRLEAGEQTVLLLNRRGFANHVLCMKCEKLVECPNCDVSLTYHKTLDKLMCHWCGHTQPLPKRCPNPKCGAEELHTLGLGTQRIEESIGELFPKARSIRVDVDTMKGRRRFLEVWEQINRREVDIILGTQMIAKGFHLEAVTLVGVISADFALFLPDFRSAERTFNLLTQVAGRAGRGERPGEVIVQSYMPHHYAIQHAARLEQDKFYKRELHIRTMLRFPPVHRLIGVLLTGEDLKLVRDQAVRLSNMLKSLGRRPAYYELKVLGPAPCPIARIENRHRWRILLRGKEHKLLHELLSEGLKAYEDIHSTKVTVSVDIDPVDLM